LENLRIVPAQTEYGVVAVKKMEFALTGSCTSDSVGSIAVCHWLGEMIGICRSKVYVNDATGASRARTIDPGIIAFPEKA
jgi:hypothetical protein